MRCLMMFKHSVKNLISSVTEKHFMFSAPHWWGFFPKIGLRKYTNFCQRHLTAVCLMLPTKWVTGHWCLDIHCDPRKFHWATTWVTPLSYPMRLRTLLFYSALWYWLLGFYNDPNVFKCLLDQWDNRFKGIIWGACRNPLLQTLSVKDHLQNQNRPVQLGQGSVATRLGRDGTHRVDRYIGNIFDWTPLRTHKAPRVRTRIIARCSVIDDTPMCLMIFEKNCAMPSTLSMSSLLLGMSTSSQVQMTMLKISKAGTRNDM